MRNSVFVLGALLAATLFGCKQNVTSASTDQVTSDLYGQVYLVDYRGRHPQDESGVLVECVGLPYSTLSDSNGNWVLHGLPTRAYHLRFSKGDYIPWEDLDYGFFAGEPTSYLTEVILFEPPRFTLTLDGISAPLFIFDSATHSRTIVGPGTVFAHTSQDAPDSTQVYAEFLFSLSPNIDIQNTSDHNVKFTTEGSAYTLSRQDTSIVIQSTFMQDALTPTEFSTGQTVYVRAFPIAPTTAVLNPRTQEYFFEPFSTPGSNVLSFVMP